MLGSCIMSISFQENLIAHNVANASIFPYYEKDLFCRTETNIPVPKRISKKGMQLFGMDFWLLNLSILIHLWDSFPIFTCIDECIVKMYIIFKTFVNYDYVQMFLGFAVSGSQLSPSYARRSCDFLNHRSSNLKAARKRCTISIMPT